MHSNKSAYDLLQLLFCKVFAQFPHAVLWALLAVVKSSVVNRQKRGVEVMMKLRKDTTHGHLCKVRRVLCMISLMFCRSMSASRIY